MTRPLVSVFLLTLLVSLVATLLCERLARRVGVVAHPREDRWKRASVPMLGGAAIMLPVVLLGVGTGRGLARFGPLLLLAMAMGAVGLVDDVKPLRPQTKFAAQIVAAAMLIGLGTLLPLTPFPLFNLFLTLFWVVGITNAFNLLDNMDGLAGGVAALTACFRLALFLIDGDRDGAWMMAALIGAVGGFLIRNLPPAKIFMGDAGSLFLGFLLSGVSLVSDTAYTRGVAAVLIVPVLIVIVPILDTTFITVTRMLGGRSVAQGGRDHTSHRLVALGMTERQALLLLLGISTVSGILAVLSYWGGFRYSVILLALLIVGLTLLAVQLGRAQIGMAYAPRLGSPAIRLVANIPYKRQVVTLAIDAVLIVVAYYAAYLLRFESAFEAERANFLRSVGPLVAIQIVSLFALGTYRGLWRYTGVFDLLRLARSAALGVGGIVVYLVFTTRFESFSRAVFVLDWVLLVLLLAGSRLAYRILGEWLRPHARTRRRTLIYGAGDGGALTLRELRNNLELRRRAVGFLDDDRDKHGTRIYGLRVLGGFDMIEELLAVGDVNEVIVASRKIAPDRVAGLEAICAAHGIMVSRAFLWIESVSASSGD